MSWTSAIDKLRYTLSDNATDKRIWRKRVVGITNGHFTTDLVPVWVGNTSFTTVDFRRVTDLAGATYPFGVFVDDVSVTVTGDDANSGVFTLSVAPAEGARVEATYYAQWFIDDQLVSFLQNAANFVLSSDDYTSIDYGLRPAALKYAAAEAYQELALRYARAMAESFRAEDLPKDALRAAMESYMKLESNFRKEAETLRDDFYKRQGRREQPAFASITGNVSDSKPNRM